MTDRNCKSCHHCHLTTLHMATPVRQELRCFRPKQHRDTRGPTRGISSPGVEGFPVAAERDNYPEPQRAANDKCGPDGNHWIAKQ